MERFQNDVMVPGHVTQIMSHLGQREKPNGKGYYSVKDMKLKNTKESITDIFLDGRESEKAAEDMYSKFCYPKRLKFIRFETERYNVSGFGHFMTMHTKAVFGMELLTASFMPGEGVSVP